MSLRPPLLIFAAGKGTRMRHLTQDRPKPLVPVAGRALIDHALQYAGDDLVSRRVVNLHTKPDMIRAHLVGQDVVFSDESAALLETGGGLRHAMPLLAGNPVATMNSDAIFTGPNPIATLISAWRPGMGALLLTVPAGRATGHRGSGDFDIAPNGRLSRGSGAVFTGVQMIDTDVLAKIDEAAFSLNRAWDILEARGQLHGAMHQGGWCDVGQPESIPLAEAMLKDAHV